jgi:MFS family permease
MSNPSSAAPASPKENLKATLIIFSGIVTGVVVFMLVAIFITQSNGPLATRINKYETMLLWGVGTVSLACLVVGRRMLWSGIMAAKNSLNPLHDKLTQYRSSLIRYLVICEVPALLSIILFMLTGNFALLVPAAVFLGFMLAVAPIRRRIVAALELDGSEQSKLD